MSRFSNRKRLLLYCPQINPASFVFFFERGDSGVSYSIRDYSQPGTVGGPKSST